MAHNHDNEDATSNLSRAFALGVALNVAFVVIEATYGVVANSTALLADAAHNASDVLGLGLAWGAASLARRKPSDLARARGFPIPLLYRTLGFRRESRATDGPNS